MLLSPFRLDLVLILHGGAVHGLPDEGPDLGPDKCADHGPDHGPDDVP